MKNRKSVTSSLDVGACRAFCRLRGGRSVRGWIRAWAGPLGQCGGGFTLIELLIIVAILGTLASIAIPVYRH